MRMGFVKSFLVSVSSVVVLSGFAYGQGVPTHIDCQVSTTVPENADFFWRFNVGPRPGDTIKLDLNATEITQLIFVPYELDQDEHSVPLHKAGAKLTKVDTGVEGLLRFEGSHQGQMFGGDFLGQLIITLNGGEATAVIDVLLLGHDGGGMVLNKSVMHCKTIRT